MRFIANGPSIPDELLVARDAGDVIFFCGAGVSQHKAMLPGFEALSRSVINRLGAALDSPARKLLDKAAEMGSLSGIGGLVATDRVFGLLEREFEIADVREAIAEAIKAPSGYTLEAHRIMLALATSRTGITRLVTTNFDLLFEECDPTLPASGPPRLPDPRSDRGFQGIIHLHGRVDARYRQAHDDEFVVSSADFGRAYLTDGWATHFIRSLLARYQIVFVGYTADDPPVQYLLEALNLRSGGKPRLYAFQSGDGGAAAALWEHRGVHAISFDSANGFERLWNTLAAWAERARNVDGWYDNLLAKAAVGPAALDPHTRGQIAHVVSTREGAHRFATARSLPDARWLLSFDPRHRYGEPNRDDRDDGISEIFDPFHALGLDFDSMPDPVHPDDVTHYRAVFDRRTVPDGAWDAFAFNRLDRDEPTERPFGGFRGLMATSPPALLPRASSLGTWFHRVAHQPIALWWAAQQTGLHPAIQDRIEAALRQDAERFSPVIRRGWRFLFAAWDDRRGDTEMVRYQIEIRARLEGWSESLIRELAGLYRPRLTVRPAFGIRHPLHWTEEDVPDPVIRIDVEYPGPHESLQLPDESLAYAVSQFRQNLELAIALEREVTGNEYLYFETTRASDGDADLPDDSYALTGVLVRFQKLMGRFAKHAPDLARAEVASWPNSDQHIFARLRIWAAGNGLLSSAAATEVFLSLPENVFWGSQHERDLLYALRDRWKDLTPAGRAAIEERLQTGSFPWSDDVQGGREKAIAYERLSRLHWLSSHGVTFDFDFNAMIAALRLVAPEWTDRAGDAAADSHSPVVRSVSVDDSPEALLETPIADILPRAKEAAQLDLLEPVQREPFRGLATRRPARALAALTHAARQGEVPRWAWSAFLSADARRTDRRRLIVAIACRLRRLPTDQLFEIAFPVTEWAERIAERLYGDASVVFDDFWTHIIKALASGQPTRRRRPESSWADEALNAPVGRLANLLLKDPAKDGLKPGAGYPPHWTGRLDQLLALPGDLRRHALVLICYQLTWLFNIDPDWTRRELLPSADDLGDDGDAFWNGVLWSARLPSRELFALLKSTLLRQAVERPHRHDHGRVIAGFLLAAWGGNPAAEDPERLVSDVELREVLIHGDDDLRGQFIWQLGHWAFRENPEWRKRVIPFLTDVWPKQRALRNAQLSDRLANLALASGDLLPKVVETILPRLVPTHAPTLTMLSLRSEALDDPISRYPKALLDLLWVILAEDTNLWPHRIEDVLDRLTQAPETAADGRLSELRRRRRQ
ncbi:SIR2 family protein [Nitrobacteraceae bacterium UC4446_H13]